MSAGVFMRTRMGRAAATPPAVITTAMRAHRIRLARKLRLRPSLSRAPNRWAQMMEKPVAMPMTKPRIRKRMLPVAPTPASAPTPSVRPTMIVSTILYICWKAFPQSSGREKKKMRRAGLPWVSSLAMNFPEWPRVQ